MNMRKMNITNRMYEAGALAIVHAETLDRVCEIAEGRMRDGIPVMEMSYTLNNIGNIIQGLSEKYGGALCVGAGTVLDAETVRHAILYGAAFIIVLNYNEEVAKMCNRYQVPYAPGYTTITECVDALSSGAAFVKAFPISDFYDPKLVKVFRTPISDMPIPASGGINLDNLTTWLESGVDVCGFGGLLAKGSSENIAANTAKIHEIITSFRYSK